MFDRFNSRRSVVHSTKGMVASSQPLANAAGIRILEKGGNCIDAAVAVSAALCVTEPTSTGIGGDCFVLLYDKKTKQVHGLNGCGKSPQSLTIDLARRDIPHGHRIPLDSVHSVTVPGAIAGWLDAIERWGSGNVTLEQIFSPAIELAENGFAVSDIAAHLWRAVLPKLIEKSGDNAKTFINEDGSFCEPGQVFKNAELARVLRLIAKEGKSGFYLGQVAQEIVTAVKKRGGFLELEDLANHTSKYVDPISIDFEGKTLWEIPPNGQGIVALLALGYLRQLETRDNIILKELGHNSAEYLNVLIEVLKLAFYDSEHLVTDADFHDLDVDKALGDEFLAERSKLLEKGRILTREHIDEVPNPIYTCDTVYFTTTDKDGNACSFINSVYSLFGSCIIPDNCGFALQSRGANFNLSKNSINSLEGGKRPYHTIIPSMITHTDTDNLFASFACMGGWNQPQAHIQIFLNMVVFGFNPQEAVDSPRFCLVPNEEFRHLDVGKGSSGPISTPATIVKLEDGIKKDVVEELAKMGHVVDHVTGYDREVFGRAQCIQNLSKNGQVVWAGGSDQRADGAAVPQI